MSMELPNAAGGELPGNAEAELRRQLAAECPPQLMAHMDRVVALVDQLAARWGLDRALARYMAQAHDVVRHLEDIEWVGRAEEYGIAFDAVERAVPVLLHGPVGAEELRRRFGVTDERVLHAVWWHTPGHPNYVPEAWAMFIADKVEPDKVERWPALAEVRRTAFEVGLEAAALQYLDLRLGEAVRKRLLVQPRLVETRNALLARLGEGRG